MTMWAGPKCRRGSGDAAGTGIGLAFDRTTRKLGVRISLSSKILFDMICGPGARKSSETSLRIDESTSSFSTVLMASDIFTSSCFRFHLLPMQLADKRKLLPALTQGSDAESVTDWRSYAAYLPKLLRMRSSLAPRVEVAGAFLTAL